ncbi:DEKNAAC103198 [Brettanomyces naardenensis]|uniref:DEKNAAC103199 n=1 Tax=Brettanomyces naardenensis TaxID=13370 RepID=A0A448YMS0_BRENA|nr:DEKNAAC103198 [Brettanomyces naardenensis]
MISAFAGSYASDKMLATIGWAWGFGTFAFITPVICVLFYIILKMNLRKAKRGKATDEKETPKLSFTQQIWKQLIEFDALGVFFFSAGLVIFLLPFNIASSAPNGWDTGYIIAMIIVGFVLLVAFGLTEAYIAPVPFVKYHFLTDRTLMGGLSTRFHLPDFLLLLEELFHIFSPSCQLSSCCSGGVYQQYIQRCLRVPSIHCRLGDS